MKTKNDVNIFCTMKTWNINSYIKTAIPSQNGTCGHNLQWKIAWDFTSRNSPMNFLFREASKHNYFRRRALLNGAISPSSSITPAALIMNWSYFRKLGRHKTGRPPYRFNTPFYNFVSARRRKNFVPGCMETRCLPSRHEFGAAWPKL